MVKVTGKRKLKVDKAEVSGRVAKILPVLKKLYPNAKAELRYRGPLQLMVATILSAQCTDIRVNMVTRKLFVKYKSVKDWAGADLEKLEEDIRSTGFFRNKAKNIKTACRQLIENFGGKVPETIDELTTLAGVGRKTANVIIMNAFGKPGISCDTHVIRLSRRLGLSANMDPVKLEFDIAEIVPMKDWSHFCHALILHGRRVCKARKPDCDNCKISQYCPSAFKPELW